MNIIDSIENTAPQTTLASIDPSDLAAVSGGDAAAGVHKEVKDWWGHARKALHHARKGNVVGYVKESADATIDSQSSIRKHITGPIRDIVK